MKKYWIFAAIFIVVSLISNYYSVKPLKYSLDILTGRSIPSDISQDMGGFRLMIRGQDPYVPISEMVKPLGLEWGIKHLSTHPPTAFLLVAPVALFKWPLASALWGWLMVGLTIVSLQAYGVKWSTAILITTAMISWSPFVFSLAQLTPIWLLGSAMAYKNRDKPIIAGAWIALASLTKFTPAVLLLPFILDKKWRVLVSFSAVWVAALVIIYFTNPIVIGQFISTFSDTAAGVIIRQDNGSWLALLNNQFGIVGMLIGITFNVIVFWIGRKSWVTYEYLSVAILPIMWTYSLLPLVPGIIKRLHNPWIAAVPILLAGIPPFGIKSVLPMAVIIICYGIGLTILSVIHQRKLSSITNSPRVN